MYISRNRKKQCGHLRCGEKCRFGPKKSKRTPIARRSAKRAAQEEEYYKPGGVRETYLKEHPYCECGCGRRSVEIHHKEGREGDRLLDVKTFMAVARLCHRKINDNPEWAMSKGFTHPRVKEDLRRLRGR